MSDEVGYCDNLERKYLKEKIEDDFLLQVNICEKGN